MEILTGIFAPKGHPVYRTLDRIELGSIGAS